MLVLQLFGMHNYVLKFWRYRQISTANFKIMEN